MAEIKQIKVGTTDYDIAAKYILDGSGNNKGWSDITSLVENKMSLVALDELPEANATSYATYKSNIVLIPNSGTGTNVKDEYVILRSGTSGSYTYSWEKIGTTDVDLSGYAKKTEAGKAGTYTSGGPSSNATGSAGAATVTTSSAGSQTATGTATITYQKANANTGNAGAVTIDGSNFTFTGTTATVTVSGSYKPAGTIGEISVSNHSHTVNVSALVAGNKQSVVTGIQTFTAGTFTQGAKASFTQGAKASLTYTARANVMCSPTVSSGVLSWGTTSADDITAWTANGNDTFTPNGDDSFASCTFSLSKADVMKSMPTITLSGAGSFTKTPVFTGTTATLSLSGDYQPAGSIGGSQSVANHSHSIGTASATVTGTAAVAVSNHTHEVTIASHTHTLGNHTHSVTIPAIA